jgi:glutathione synthase/RimK-type ligase-like ATP-grasp enzyme
MGETILILTDPSDVHAQAVALSLRNRGATALVWYTTDFPSRATETVLFEKGVERTRLIAVGERDLASYGISRVWRRRPAQVSQAADLHPADQSFAESEVTAFRNGLFSMMLPGAVWVNPPDAGGRAGRKMVQHQAALSVGLRTPDTVYSNDPSEVLRFLRRHDGKAVYKTFRPISWRDQETTWAPYTSLLTEEQLVKDSLLQAVPGIYQEVIPKRYELRVTLMGCRSFSARINSQETTAGKLDWRKAYNELRMEAFALPPDLARACFHLMKRLGIVFGCLDFIVTPEGEYVFLEINEMGQFLFVEYFTGLPLLDAFTEFLVQGTEEFDWSADRVRVRYADVEDEALALVEQAKAAHITVPDSTIDELLFSAGGREEEERSLLPAE